MRPSSFPAPVWMHPTAEKVGTRLPEDIVRVDRGDIPPVLGGRQLENGGVKMGRVLGGISGRADIADNLPLFYLVAFVQTIRIPFEVGVVVTELFGRVELIDGPSAGFAL